MSFGDGLATFGRGYAVVSAMVVTLIIIVLTVMILLGKLDKMMKVNPPGSPNGEATPEEMRRAKIMWVIVGALIIAFSWLIVWLTMRFRPVAQVEGVLGGINILSGIGSLL